MPTSYGTEGLIQLTGVSFPDGDGSSFSRLEWTGTSVPSFGNLNYPLYDNDDSGSLTPGDFVGNVQTTYTGYTITAGGVDYGIFLSNGNYYVYLPQDGSTQTIIPNGPGNSNLYLESNAIPDYLCFAAGTEISTPCGDVAVETLAPGDLLCNQAGATVPVKWIGRQTVSTRFGPAERLMPVRFAAGSLGGGLPHTDLTVTADHGMLVEGVICHAGALVNGTTITRVPLAEMGETYTVYHIETESHEIILANGAPAETYIDNVSRRAFDNYAEFDALYGDVPEMEELPYPRAMSARQVPASIRVKLAARRVA